MSRLLQVQEQCQLFLRREELNVTCWLQTVFTENTSDAPSGHIVFFSDTFSFLQAFPICIQLTCNHLRLDKPYRRHFQHFTDKAPEIAQPGNAEPAFQSDAIIINRLPKTNWDRGGRAAPFQRLNPSAPGVRAAWVGLARSTARRRNHTAVANPVDVGPAGIGGLAIDRHADIGVFEIPHMAIAEHDVRPRLVPGGFAGGVALRAAQDARLTLVLP